MQNVLIVEDDLIQLNMLCECIKKEYPGWIVQSACSYHAAEHLLNESVSLSIPFTLLLLDVQLSGGSTDRGGFFLAKTARRFPCYYRVPILFLTALSHEESFALSEFHCYNYISKPYTDKDILFQLEQMLLTGYLNQTIELTDTNRILHRISPEDIYYIESQAHTLLVFTTKGKINTRQYTLVQLASILDSNFIRCHKKYIINRDYVQSYDRISQYVRINGTSISIGRTYIRKVDECLLCMKGE